MNGICEENIYDENIYDENIYDENIYDENIYDENICDENICDEGNTERWCPCPCRDILYVCPIPPLESLCISETAFGIFMYVRYRRWNAVETGFFPSPHNNPSPP